MNALRRPEPDAERLRIADYNAADHAAALRNVRINFHKTFTEKTFYRFLFLFNVFQILPVAKTGTEILLSLRRFSYALL